MITAFIGKGGVGKTTVASAYATMCAGKGRTLIVSSDFMPSLRHIFRDSVENLEVMELSENEVASRWKERYGAEVSEVLGEFVDVEPWILDHIASSPGVAEEFMIANIVELEESGRYDNVVWDTAASSSTMHLLLLEREFYEHLDRDVRIYLRLKNRFRLSKAFSILEEWKSLANRVWEGISKVSFQLVSTMDELSLIQAGEIEKDMDSMGLTIGGKVFNRCRVTSKERPGNVIEIPELSGSAIDIVRAMIPFLSGLDVNIPENGGREPGIL